jgi:propanol-preferring alcohol dehydrogenase
LKEADVRPGQWVIISGIGGLGHIAVQYATAMGLHVGAVDVEDGKLALARELGAEITVNAMRSDAASEVQRTIGGAHAVLITAVSLDAFRHAIGMLRRGGTCVLVGLPPGEIPIPVFDVVLKRLTIRGSIVGTRNDLQEALRFAADGTVRVTSETQPLEAINDVFGRLRKRAVRGRVVLKVA